MLWAAIVIMSVAYSVSAKAQPSSYVEYCKALRAAYRQAVTDGKPASPAAGEAGANCPTNPNGSIPVFERVLKDMNVALPKRP